MMRLCLDILFVSQANEWSNVAILHELAENLMLREKEKRKRFVVPEQTWPVNVNNHFEPTLYRLLNFTNSPVKRAPYLPSWFRTHYKSNFDFFIPKFLILDRQGAWKYIFYLRSLSSSLVCPNLASLIDLNAVCVPKLSKFTLRHQAHEQV